MDAHLPPGASLTFVLRILVSGVLLLGAAYCLFAAAFEAFFVG
jgi:hypothetical protein